MKIGSKLKVAGWDSSLVSYTIRLGLHGFETVNSFVQYWTTSCAIGGD